MMPGGDRLPNPATVSTFGAGAAAAMDLAVGPGNELYYVDLGGTVRRIRYFPGDQPSTAVLNVSPTSGPTPLTVNFDGSGSTDPDPADQNLLTYQWDFTNDGTFDATSPTASYVYSADGTYTAALKVTDTLGVSDTKTVTITAGNGAPAAFIDSPTSALTWQVGDTIAFNGHATDPQDGALPDSALSWQVLLQHCSSPTVCHVHFLPSFNGVASGSFTAPDHVPLVPPSGADRDRLRRADRYHDGEPETENRRPEFQHQPLRAPADRRLDEPDRAVHPYRHAAADR